MNTNADVRRPAAAAAAMLLATALLARGEPAPIPGEQLGAVATKQVEGEGLSIAAAGDGARLQCAFQRLEAEATPEGLWLRSTGEKADGKRFRVVAVSVGRVNVEHPTSNVERPMVPGTGPITVDGDRVRFIRPGLTEEYSVSVDGIRQDFLIAERPAGTGELRLELALRGAHAAPAAHGARLTLDGSDRTLAYSRLRAADAAGRELAAWMEVRSADELTVRVDDADATYPVRIDPTFSDADWVSMNSLPGADLVVLAFAVDATGNLYVGGRFIAIGTVVANHIAMWSGSEWSTLGSGMNGVVHALTVSGTDLYAGGEFTTAGGVSANRIAKWDGSSWSALGSGVDGSEVRALAMMGTNLYAGGEFTTAGGVAANNIAKWDGSSWSALGSGISGVGHYYAVMALAVLGTDLYVGGDFTTAGGVTVNHIAKWNGSAWSALGSGTSGGGAYGGVMALAVTGTDLYVGGDFRTAGGVTANDVAKWNGSDWSPVGSGMGPVKPSAMSWVWSLALTGTDLYAGGFFGTAGGVPANHLAKWNGSTWAALDSEFDDAFDDVYALSVIGGDLYVGGGFGSVGGVRALNVAKYDGGSWSAMGTGMGGPVGALAVMGTDLYVMGSFPNAPSGVPANNIAKWDGSDWSALGSGLGGFENNWGCALAVMGTDLYAAGGFTTAGGVSANHIAKWDGSIWSALGSGLSPEPGGDDCFVCALAVSGTDLYVGGLFGAAGGVPANNIARWDGTSWSALGSGVEGGGPGIRALAVIGNELYAGGYFATAGGVTVNAIAKWNGNAWSALGSGMLFEDSSGGIGLGVVYALAGAGTDLYAGGVFTTAGGVPARSIAKWNGSAWSALHSGTSSEPEWYIVEALAASGSNLYAGGLGYLDEWTSYAKAAWWNDSQWSALASTLTGAYSGAIRALATDNAGHLFVGGSLLSAGTTVSPYIAQVNITGLDFIWDVIASPEEAGVPFPVTVTAGNAAGEVRADFTNAVSLSGYAPGLATTTISIGAGPGTWGYPLHTRYHDARTQVIYPAGEIGRACTITSVAIEVVSPPGQTLENWTIRMQHTSLAEYSASPEWESSDWTVVYQGNEPAGTAGWRAFLLSAPFEYDGTNNVLVDFSFNNASYSSEGQCRATDVGSYRAITFATDSAYGDPLSWSGTSPTPARSQMAPNVVLGATFPDLLPVPVSPTLAGPFVDGVWSGEVIIADAYSGVILRADDGLGHEGESNPFDVEAAVVVDTDDDGLPDAWELAWFPSLTNVTFQSDWDGDGFRDGFECAAGTSPVDAGSYLGITSVELNSAGTEAVIRWSSVTNKLYSVYGGSDLIQGLDVLLDEHLPATPPGNTYTDMVDGVEVRTYGVEAEW